MSKKYADLVGATLTVTSDYGQGSTFSVSLSEARQAA
jgi:signal transduction histidine kinase